MGQTLYQKIYDAHVVREQSGETPIICIDRHLVHEVTSPQAFEALRLAGRPVHQPTKTYATMDHNVSTRSLAIDACGPESETQMRTLARNCAEFGVQLYAIGNINQGIAAGDRVLGLLDEKSRIPEATGAVRLEQFRDSIEFRDVSFSYDDSRKVIDSVSFTIRKGETVALVGPSGGGKSTLSDLIPRFYDVTSGAILVDGIDLREYQLDSLRSHMGIVTQETILFNDTIAGNIRLGKRDATDAEVEAAARVPTRTVLSARTSTATTRTSATGA